MSDFSFGRRRALPRDSLRRIGDERAHDATTEGMGAKGYYDAHSEYQRIVVEGGDETIRSAVAGLTLPENATAATIADYGAGTGATSVHAMGTAIAALRERSPGLPLLAVHNDVVTNDFTQLFRNVAGDGGYLDAPGAPVYPAAAAGSFFTQVLPAETVHLGMCSNAAHWLREQPHVFTPEGMYFSQAGDATAELAAQAARDWLAFLDARAAELAPGGRLVVQGIGTSPDGEHVSADRLLRVMWRVAVSLAGDGLLDRGALDDYVFPVYCRSSAELTAPVEGGPLADRLEVVAVQEGDVPNPYWATYERDRDAAAYAKAYTDFVRAFAESSMKDNLFDPASRGEAPAAVCDEFFTRLEAATASDPDAGRYEAWIVRVVLGRTAGGA
jgi:cyclopropane-fatty-acyl-phospholipid synthase